MARKICVFLPKQNSRLQPPHVTELDQRLFLEIVAQIGHCRNVSFRSTFPMLVPSLSWQMFDF